MRILFLSTGCGEGHNSMAKAYLAECVKRGHDAEIYDIFGQLPRENKLFNGGYIFAVKYIPKLYHIVWEYGRKHTRKKVSGSYYRSMKNVYPLLSAKIDEFKPDIIVSLHSNCGGAVEILNREGKIPASVKRIVAVFDYVICPQFEYGRDADFVITPSEICHAELAEKGYAEAQMKCFGFPVHQRFLQNYDKTAVRKELGLADKFTVLTIAGGAGLGKTSKLVKSIAQTDGDIQILAVCGRNEEEKRRIDGYAAATGNKNIKAYGFTDKVAQLMAASDIAFARGGGNGISECFYSGLPIVFRNGLVNNEWENRKLFVAEKMCDCIKNAKQAGEKAAYYKNNPQELEQMRGKIKAFVKPDPVKNAVDFFESLTRR